MTLGQFAHLLLTSADKQIKNDSFVEFAVNLVRSIFEGNQPYVEGTPEDGAIHFHRARFEEPGGLAAGAFAAEGEIFVQPHQASRLEPFSTSETKASEGMSLGT